jgi:hypothetical protein
LTEGDRTSQQIQTCKPKDIFQKTDYQTIKAFVDGLLVRSKASKEMLKKYGKRTHELRKDVVPILHQAAGDSNADIFRFLLDSVQATQNTDTLSVLLLAKGNDRQTVWHLAAVRANVQAIESLLECARKKLTTE